MFYIQQSQKFHVFCGVTILNYKIVFCDFELPVQQSLQLYKYNGPYIYI